MSHISVTWPADGATGWGALVDRNLNAIAAKSNAQDDAITTLTTGPGGLQGPPGPAARRFYTGTAWPARPVGAETSPIINVSTAYPGASLPPDGIEGDVWLPAGPFAPLP